MPLSKTHAPFTDATRVEPRAGTRFQRWRASQSMNPDTRGGAAKATLGRVAAHADLKAQGRYRQANVPLSTRLKRIFRVRPTQRAAGM